MRPEEYRNVIKGLETHYQEFMRTSQGSEMFGEEEKKLIQGNFDQAQAHYDKLIVQLPAYSEFKFSLPYSYECNGLLPWIVMTFFCLVIYCHFTYRYNCLLYHASKAGFKQQI